MEYGLNMIVKDEAHCIEECLDSVLHLINWWVIVDTGSTDGTQDIIRKYFARNQIQGVLYERPWVDFAHNRNEALQLAREWGGVVETDINWVWLLDADERFITGNGEIDLREIDGLYGTAHYGELDYQRMIGINLDSGWQWKGVVHEVLDLPGARTAHTDVIGLQVRTDVQSARSRDPEKYIKDAHALSLHLIDHPDDTRARFYLAQSYRDAGEIYGALTQYKARAADEAGWWQERWYAQFQLGRMQEIVGDEQAPMSYELAFEMNPERPEPLVCLSRYWRARDKFRLALMFAGQALVCAEPKVDDLFVDTAAYQVDRWDEVAISAWKCGYWDLGENAAKVAFSHRPEDERLKRNLEYYLDRRGGLDQVAPVL